MERSENTEQYLRIVNSQIAKVEVEFAKRHPFSCQTAQTTVGPMKFVRMQSDPVEISRSLRCIEDDSQSQYIVGINLSGRTVIKQSYLETVVNQGHLFLLDKMTPYCASVTEAADRVLISIPRRILESRLPDPSRYLSVAPQIHSGMARLAVSHLQFLASEGPQLSSPNRLHAVEMAFDLIALAFQSCEEEAIEQEPAGSRSSQLLLSRAKAYLRCHLNDPDISPANVSRALNVSKRYLHKLFSTAGTTFGAWVREERLLRARSQLTDQRSDHLTITEVALRQGFNDIPHFSRQFKARFGHTPRLMRTQALRDV